LPSRLAQRKVRIARFWSSRTVLTAISVVGAGPRINAKPGIRPSTNWIPNSRMIVSEMNPCQPGGIWWPLQVRRATKASWANIVAAPASSPSPRYGSHRSSVGTGRSSSRACSTWGFRSPSVLTSNPIRE